MKIKAEEWKENQGIGNGAKSFTLEAESDEDAKFVAMVAASVLAHLDSERDSEEQPIMEEIYADSNTVKVGA